MEDTNITAATIISFAETLEDQSAQFYTELAALLPRHKDKLLGYAREDKKSKILIVRTYQETITDALEACYSFEKLNLQDFAVDEQSAKTLTNAIALEVKAIRFYNEVAAQGESLLGTIPRAFRRVAEGRKKRLGELQGLH